MTLFVSLMENRVVEARVRYEAGRIVVDAPGTSRRWEDIPVPAGADEARQAFSCPTP